MQLVTSEQFTGSCCCRSPAASVALEKRLKIRKIATQSLWMHLLAIARILLSDFLSFSTFPLNLLPMVSDRAAFFLQQLLQLTSAFLQGSIPCLLHLAGSFSLLPPFLSCMTPLPFQFRYLEDGNSLLSFLLPQPFTYSSYFTLASLP